MAPWEQGPELAVLAFQEDLGVSETSTGSDVNSIHERLSVRVDVTSSPKDRLQASSPHLSLARGAPQVRAQGLEL